MKKFLVLAALAAAAAALSPQLATAQVTGTCITGCVTPTAPTFGVTAWGGFQSATASQAGAVGKINGVVVPVGDNRSVNETFARGEGLFTQGVDIKSFTPLPGSACTPACADNRAITTLSGQQVLSAGALNTTKSTGGEARAHGVTGVQGVWHGGAGLTLVAPPKPAQ